MNKKKWLLLLIFLAVLFASVKLFYKTLDKDTVPANADAVIAIDSKRIINTLIWQTITEPSEWNISNPFRRNTDTVLHFKDLIDIPDYAFAFHINGQPIAVWYMQLTVNDTSLFEQELLQNNFEKIGENVFENRANNLLLLRKNSKIIIGISTTKSQINEVANDLFEKKNFITYAVLKTIIDNKSHATAYLQSNTILKKPAFINVNFDKRSIKMQAKLQLKSIDTYSQEKFAYNDTAICSLGFSQSIIGLLQHISNDDKTKMSTALNINIDSFFQPQNKKYSFQISDFKTRTDSAISYSYDDDFNKIEKVIVNNVEEPVLQIEIIGSDAIKIFAYLECQKKIEKTAAGFLFTPIPFVKSYCFANDTLLQIKSSNYETSTKNTFLNAFFFANLSVEKIPIYLQKYFSGDVKKLLENVATINILATKNSGETIVNASISKKKSKKILISF